MHLIDGVLLLTVQEERLIGPTEQNELVNRVNQISSCRVVSKILHRVKIRARLVNNGSVS